MVKSDLKKYAELLIKTGVNLQKGEMLVITAPINAVELVRETTKFAYKMGASNVNVLWNDEVVTKYGYKYRSKKQLSEVPEWIVAQREYFIEKKIAYLVIISDDPENLKGINPEKIATARRASGKALKKFREYTGSNKIRWSIGAYPNKAWAKKMFPNLPSNLAVKKQWEYIAKTVRLDYDNPVKEWENHQKMIENRCKILNEANIKTFTYKNSLGTNLTVGMPDGYLFCGGGEQGSLDGVWFTANLPTEEVFSSPDRKSINGKLYSSMPLCRNGSIIKDFWFEFKDGRIIDFGAKEGYDNLKSIIDTDEGSHYLGEIALVGYNSPIRNLETMFYETLFDENASCHFAIGSCYAGCLKGGTELSTEQLLERGLNDSIEHVDFMVGTKDLSITATTKDGKEFAVFKDGDWVF
ncbi:MAG: aminopeptidase [Clostridiales bacterium]|nr:aminopeptidase [Clostridiales bacterium]